MVAIFDTSPASTHRGWIDLRLRLRIGRWRIRLRPSRTAWIVAAIFGIPAIYLLSLGPLYSLVYFSGIVDSSGAIDDDSLLGKAVVLTFLPMTYFCQICEPFLNVMTAYLSMWGPDL
jgi:hypothetical protein